MLFGYSIHLDSTMSDVTRIPTAYSVLGMEMHISPHAAGGAAAGFVSSTLLYPLELVKSRFQMGSHAKFSYSSTVSALRTIYKSHGIQELYRGFPAGLVGSTLSWGMYFWIYEDLKRQSVNLRGGVSGVTGPFDHWASSIVSSIIVQTILCPLWVIKLNQQLGNVDGFFPAFSQLYRREGLRGLYRGLIPGYWSCSHLAVQFVMYEELKKLHAFDSVAANTLFATIVSKSLATVLTSPVEVVKVRLRSSSVSSGQTIRGICREIWQRERVRGFYKGVGTALMRILPGQCLTFLTYEFVVRWVNGV
jgi:solute carrier family 25 (mitochondrial folate transporter), member 32